MKVGFSVPFHISTKWRPDGEKYGDAFLSTLFEYVNYDKKVYLVDNASEFPYNYKKYNEHKKLIQYTYTEDQSISGITGAWNLGVHQAYEDGCDIIIVTSDDIQFNNSINSFIKFIEEHEHNDISLYGPLTNGVSTPKLQRAKSPTNKIIETFSGDSELLLNGFTFAFTRKFYEKFRYDEHNLLALIHKYSPGKTKWSGQERNFLLFKDNGARFL